MVELLLIVYIILAPMRAFAHSHEQGFAESSIGRAFFAIRPGFVTGQQLRSLPWVQLKPFGAQHEAALSDDPFAGI